MHFWNIFKEIYNFPTMLLKRSYQKKQDMWMFVGVLFLFMILRKSMIIPTEKEQEL